MIFLSKGVIFRFHVNFLGGRGYNSDPNLFLRSWDIQVKVLQTASNHGWMFWDFFSPLAKPLLSMILEQKLLKSTRNHAVHGFGLCSYLLGPA